MKRQDRPGETRTEPQPKQRDSRERTVAPPIEREHETQEGVHEENEKRREDERD
jgi:hypothetical protein